MKKFICVGALAASLCAFFYPKEKEVAFYMSPESERLFSSGMERMEKAGANYTGRQLYVMLSTADVNNDARLEVAEAEELFNDALNPVAPLGRLALPYRGPEQLDDIKPIYQIPEKWERLARALMDADGDSRVSKQEVLRGIYKINGG